MIIGHQRILDFLKKSIESNKIAHAYLFVGPENVGKRTIAMEFIKILQGENSPSTSSRLSSGLRSGNNYCLSERSESKADIDFHPDVLIIEPETIEKEGIKKEKEISLEQARQIRRQISLFPYQAPYKIVLIDAAEKMTREAANALLKTLEEPSGRAVLILITANSQLLLPTIVSRCRLVKFLPVPAEEIENELGNRFGDLVPKKEFLGLSPQISKITRLCAGRPGLAIQYLENPKLLEKQEENFKELQKIIQSDLNERYQYAENLSKDISRARQTLNQWLIFFRDLLLSAIGCQEQVGQPLINGGLPHLLRIIKAIKKTDLLLANSSINARLALEVLMLEF